jgi:F420-dependent oxidoreductase-like protein
VTPSGTIGVQLQAPDAAETLRIIERLESLGIAAAWLITGGVVPDGLTVLAAAAARTSRILLGTAITPLFTRHPIVIAQQALALASLAPGRFRLGIGSSGKGIERYYGIPYVRPLAHTRAALTALRALLQDGAVDLEEAGIVAHARLTGPPPGVPVYISALQRRSFFLAGRLADGAITWICPAAYVRDVALPAVRDGAARAKRPAPPLVMHVPVLLSDDAGSVREAFAARFGFYARLPHYAAMFTAAGFPEVQNGQWSDRMIEAVAVWGSEAAVIDRLRGFLAMGAGELMVSPVGAGSDPVASVDRTLRLLARVQTA